MEQPAGYQDRLDTRNEVREIAAGLREPPSLPCYPCPHRAKCCHWGAALDDDEAEVLMEKHGEASVHWFEADREWRTALTRPREDGGVCVFLNPLTNGCTIWQQPEYPVVCKGFPWRSGILEEPYLYDLTICPEFETRPELVAIERVRPKHS